MQNEWLGERTLDCATVGLKSAEIRNVCAYIVPDMLGSV
jgi:hypothetical protein